MVVFANMFAKTYNTIKVVSTTTNVTYYFKVFVKNNETKKYAF